MDNHLNKIKLEIYDACGFEISNYKLELESKEYKACRFKLNDKHIISRSAKITPKKVGQFVTFWKRSNNGPIEPFSETDQIDFFVINVCVNNKWGQFVFPKSVLIKKGIISAGKKEGKRGFRVYSVWDIVANKQAERTQKWQLDYFFEINSLTALEKAIKLYELV